MVKIWLIICSFLLLAEVFAAGGNDFVFRKGKVLLDVPAYQMKDTLIFSGEVEAGIHPERQVPEGQNTLVYEVSLPEYQEGLFLAGIIGREIIVGLIILTVFCSGASGSLATCFHRHIREFLLTEQYCPKGMPFCCTWLICFMIGKIRLLRN